MAGPVLTILLDIFFSPGLSYSSTVVQAVTHTHTHTHTYTDISTCTHLLYNLIHTSNSI